MDGLGLNNLQSSSMLQMQQAQGKLDQLKVNFNNPQDKDLKKLKKAAQEFEAIFVQQLLDSMDKTVMREEDSVLGGGSSEEYFRSMLNEEVSKSMSTRLGGSGFGLAETIYRQMAKSFTPGPDQQTSEVKQQ